MSAQSGPDVAALLAEHTLHDDGKKWVCVMSSDVHPQRVFLCRWSRQYRRLNPDAAHRAHQGQVIREAYADWLLTEWVGAAEHLCRRTHPTRWEIGTLSEACDACQLAATDATAYLADLLRGQA